MRIFSLARKIYPQHRQSQQKRHLRTIAFNEHRNFVDFVDAKTPHKSRLTRRSIADRMIASRNHGMEAAVSEELIPIGVVAKEFGVSSATVRRWVWQKALTAAVVTAGGHMRFHHCDVQKFKLANIARRVGQLPEPPGPEETVESKIETFLENMMITHSHLVWRPARKRRYDPLDRLRDEPALAALATAERNRQAKLDDDTIQAVTGSTRKELYGEMAANSVAAVAERMGATETKLREFCSWFRIPIPNERAASVRRRKRLGRGSRRD